MDRYKQGDTAPPFTAVLLDGDARFDATGASSVTFKAWRNGVAITPQAADHVGADGVCTCTALTALVTAAPGKVLSQVVVQTANGPQTFPPKGFLETHVYPNAPTS
jgi:hypothetical protein